MGTQQHVKVVTRIVPTLSNLLHHCIPMLRYVKKNRVIGKKTSLDGNGLWAAVDQTPFQLEMFMLKRKAMCRCIPP